MDINNLFESKLFKAIIAGIVLLVIFLFGFRIGVFVGFRKAEFASNWGENYHKNFAGPREGFFNEFVGKNSIDANGAFGQIIRIDGQTLIIKEADDVEKVILIGNDTAIRRFQDNLELTDLKVDDMVVIIGNPNNQGQIEAKLIRIMPSENPSRMFPPNNLIPRKPR